MIKPFIAGFLGALAGALLGARLTPINVEVGVSSRDTEDEVTL